MGAQAEANEDNKRKLPPIHKFNDTPVIWMRTSEPKKDEQIIIIGV